MGREVRREEGLVDEDLRPDGSPLMFDESLRAMVCRH